MLQIQSFNSIIIEIYACISDKFCRERGMTLLSIETEEEQLQLAERIQDVKNNRSTEYRQDLK